MSDDEICPGCGAGSFLHVECLCDSETLRQLLRAAQQKNREYRTALLSARDWSGCVNGHEHVKRVVDKALK